MTKARRSTSRALVVILLWVLGGALVLFAGGLTWWTVSLSNGSDQAEQGAERAANAARTRAHDVLAKAIVDGELSDSEIAGLASVGDFEVLGTRRTADRISVSGMIATSYAGAFGGSSVRRCVDYEVSLPITPGTRVDEHDVDPCVATP